MTYLPLFRDLEKLFYAKTDGQGTFIEGNNVLHRHLSEVGLETSTLELLFTPRDLRVLRAACARAYRADWGIQVQVAVRWVHSEPLAVRLHIVNLEGELVFLAWPVSMDDRVKVLRELAWLMSHVIRKPVANLLGLLPLIERTAENAQVLDYAHDAVRELDAGIRVVSDLISKQ